MPQYVTPLLQTLPEQQLRDYILFSLSFSLCHATVMSCVAYSSTEFPGALSRYSNGTLYICNAICAFLVAGNFVQLYGPKFTMIVGLVGNCVFVFGFLISLIFPDSAWFIFIVSSAVGGAASGLQWTAQGKYFSTAAALYSSGSGIELETCNAKFVSIFASIFLCLEVLLKISATGIFFSFPAIGPIPVFSLYSTMSVISCVLICRVSDLGLVASESIMLRFTLSDAVKSSFIIVEDQYFFFIGWFQLASGLSLSFVSSYVYGTIIARSEVLGHSYVGLLAASVVICAAFLSMISSTLIAYVGKQLVIFIAGACIVALGIVLLLVPDDELGTWRCICPYLMLEGVTLGVWESLNKAIVADMYGTIPNKSEDAFAMLYFFFFVGNGFGFFFFGSMTRVGMVFTLIIFGLLGGCMYQIALQRYNLNNCKLKAENGISNYGSSVTSDMNDIGDPNDIS